MSADSRGVPYALGEGRVRHGCGRAGRLLPGNEILGVSSDLGEAFAFAPNDLRRTEAPFGSPAVLGALSYLAALLCTDRLCRLQFSLLCPSDLTLP